ncbi:hypothetical protein [Paractinoplanes maris]|uniref:hypothetical protein n=1 Tax=Paractinoplanes maris TaxID=1734446 RepID=UPI0020214825|nr:hypothetical protein [Actinoplanes maris]
MIGRRVKGGWPAAGRVVAALAGAVAALAAIPLAVVASAPGASAATSQFQGVNWARAGDNFTGEPLVLYGLNAGDSYRNAGQCSGLQAGGEGPRWEGRQARAVP